MISFSSLVFFLGSQRLHFHYLEEADEDSSTRPRNNFPNQIISFVSSPHISGMSFADKISETSHIYTDQ